MLTLTPKWYSPKEAAQLLGYGRTKVKMLIAQRKLKSTKDGGSRKILSEWIDEYIAERTKKMDE